MTKNVNKREQSAVQLYKSRNIQLHAKHGYEQQYLHLLRTSRTSTRQLNQIYI